jgi:transglutaminase-like putative cysteine protease
VEQSRYGRAWALAQELRAAASSPLDLVRRVRRRVQQGARYTERPPLRDVPLDAFLFETRAGYCQQFSGAMVAAGLPAWPGSPGRVASGSHPRQPGHRSRPVRRR